MSGEGAVTESSTSYPVLDTGTVSLDEPDYNQMKEDRRNRTRAAMKVYNFSRSTIKTLRCEQL